MRSEGSLIPTRKKVGNIALKMRERVGLHFRSMDLSLSLNREASSVFHHLEARGSLLVLAREGAPVDILGPGLVAL